MTPMQNALSLIPVSHHACPIRMLYHVMHYLMNMLRWVIEKKFWNYSIKESKLKFSKFTLSTVSKVLANLKNSRKA